MIDAAIDGSSETRRTALGTLLIERGLLDEDRLQEALEVSEENGERLGEVLVRLAWVSEEDLAQVLADQWHMRYCERSAISFDGEALRRMSHEDAARLEALPIQVAHDGALVVALAEPTDARIHALRTLLGDNVDFVVVAKGAIEAGLRSDLLARNVGGQFATFAENGEAPVEQPAADTPVFDEPGLFEGPSVTVPVTVVPSSSDFEELARSLTDTVGQHLASLRAFVEQADERARHDRQEIERLQTELSTRNTELSERDEAIQSTQQMLRDLADGLANAPQH